MNINCTFKNFEPSDHLKDYVRTRFVKLGKYVPNPDDCEIQVNLSVEKIRNQAEVTLDADNIHLSAYEASEEMYATIDLVLDKMEARLRKMREKIKDRRKSKTRDARFDVVSFGEVEGGGKAKFIVKTDRYEVKPMSVEEAAERLESADQDFLVFRNAEGDAVNVIYKRKNGDFGLIDPGMF
jgi:putative sigma-54 modulation protein